MLASRVRPSRKSDGQLLRPRHHHPARAVAADPVGLGESAERQAEDVVTGVGRGVVVHRLVDLVREEDLLVDLVGHQDEVVAAGDVGHARDDLVAVDRAGRVVGVDDDQGVGVLGDLGLDVGEVRVPAVGLVAAVVDRRPPGQGHGPGPQRVVRRRDEDLVAVVDEGGEHHRDQLGDTVADVDVVDVRVGQPARLVVVRDGGAGGVDAAGVAVALRVRQVVDHVLEDRLRRLEPERRGVADVELEDLVPLGLEPLGLLEDRPAHVVADLVELAGLRDSAHGFSLPATRPWSRRWSPMGESASS